MLYQYFIQVARRSGLDRRNLVARSGAAAAALGLIGFCVIAPSFTSAQVNSSVPSSTFIVFVRGERIGSEDVALARSSDGWTITSSGRIGPPLDLVIKELQIRYTSDWKPIELRIDATAREQPVMLRTTVSDTTATTNFTQAGQSGERTTTIAPDAVMLPTPFWAPFEALAQRLKLAAPGSTLQAFSGGLSFPVAVGDSSDETIQTPSQTIKARRTAAKFEAPGAPLDLTVWGDENGRLLRLSIPAQNLEVAREDIASVATRRVTVSRPNDEQVRVPANGFTLAGTISKPVTGTARQLPAVILVAGSGPQDRDETVFGIPIFGQLAGRLADAGFLVLRYDKRGVGQSGGRIESATLADYVDDLRAAVRLVSDRKDVNRRQLAVIGHSEGGAVALLAAAKENRIAALGLLASTGVTGADLNMAQVAHGLERSKRSESERQETIALQKKIQTAVLTDKGWEEIPPALRRQAEVPWFKSFLAYDPARIMPDVRQPILIVQGQLDTQVEPSNADALEKLARARQRGGSVDVVRVPGINHLLVPAVTGEFDEYASLKDQTLSEAVSTAVVDWLSKTFAPR
jgi:pimeloyl-ACP methyl ester carboxylesterase